ncbi:MAG: Gfo/Idh/MocA family oxidoreductase [Bacteroidetes bacterium]|nr:Gfo/Idh/MocA family oxidoreductase [Bacteroidota bacterium]MCL5026496.1 Gfo/Idh/MocA family oxidoreductase [Chloroflexota bacterium]
MQKLGIGVIGTGLLGERHTRVYSEMPNVRVVAVAEVREDRGRAVAAKYGARWYSDYNEMLKDPRIRAVSVVTPDHAHKDPVIACLQAGKHVLAEKPIATTPEDTEAMLRAARDTGLIFMVNYSQRLVAEHAWIKRVINAGEIGGLRMAQSFKHDRISVPTDMLRGWSAHSSPIYFMSSHDIDLVQWYIGAAPEEVSAYQTSGVLKKLGFDTMDGIQALVKFANGAVVMFHSSWIHPNFFPTLTDNYMEIIGEKGTIYLKERRAGMYNDTGGQVVDFTGPATATEVQGRLLGAFRDSLEQFVNSIGTGTEPMTSAAKTAVVSAIQFAIHDSLKEERPVKTGGYLARFDAASR